MENKKLIDWGCAVETTKLIIIFIVLVIGAGLLAANYTAVRSELIYWYTTNPEGASGVAALVITIILVVPLIVRWAGRQQNK